jgi:hypothetical protein
MFSLRARQQKALPSGGSASEWRGKVDLPGPCLIAIVLFITIRFSANVDVSALTFLPPLYISPLGFLTIMIGKFKLLRVQAFHGDNLHQRPCKTGIEELVG